ncbi:MAG: hypothetical protein P1V97_34970, partial [Planctomycetota bacterium]|nr:hypothetical protein [Planctomycetota bacterium]
MNEAKREAAFAGSIKDLLGTLGDVFVRFDERSQDSGNISYGVSGATPRLFVKTAGKPRSVKTAVDFRAREALLRNAADFYSENKIIGLPQLRRFVETDEGPVLIFDWIPGDLIWTPPDQRDDATSAYQRFQQLECEKRRKALDRVYRIHVELCGRGYVAVDFYDGSIMYDFEQHLVNLIDLDHYHIGPFMNERGRMFGSRRFMSPEEFAKGQLIDERSTVFTMGRLAKEFLLGESSLRTDDQGLYNLQAL